MAKLRSQLLASSVRDTSLAGYELTAEERWRKFDISALLVSNFATVPAALLPVYTEQYRISQYVTNDIQARAFLIKVIGLYRRKGTGSAVREALAAVGWPAAVIIETGPNAVAAKYDGQFKYDGLIQHGGGAWATFKVEIPLSGKPAPPATEVVFLTDIINEFKPARCQLISLTFV